jgi:hypothetical protein
MIRCALLKHTRQNTRSKKKKKKKQKLKNQNMKFFAPATLATVVCLVAVADATRYHVLSRDRAGAAGAAAAAAAFEEGGPHNMPAAVVAADTAAHLNGTLCGLLKPLDSGAGTCACSTSCSDCISAGCVWSNTGSVTITQGS